MSGAGAMLFKKSELEGLCSKVDTEFGFTAEEMTLEGPSREMPLMKELLLIHLDLVQQQSEQLTTKEKQISDLRTENEMLKLRIDRMERRVSLQKNRSVENGSSVEATVGRKRGRRRSLESVCSVRGPKRLCPPGSQQNNHGGAELRRNSRKREEDEARDGSKNGDDSSVHLTTESSYYTSIGEQECMWGSELRTTTRTTTLEVPQWRIKNYSSSYTMEGTENLSEDVFDRRHFRLSIDEKRRKRWDVQRMREERQVERLKQRERQRQREETQHTESFFPSPHPASLSLTVRDFVPVSVFGINIPTTKNIDFSLPWLTGKEKPPRSFGRRSKR